MNKNKFNKCLTFYKGKRILVTGGSGYIGTHLINILSDVDCEIIKLDNRIAMQSKKKRLAKIIDIIGDIRDKKTWNEIIEEIDVIFHFAAQTSVYVADGNPVDDLNINVVPIINMLSTCKKKNTKPIILFSSTVTTVGIPRSLPVNEAHSNNPISIYDLHKIIAENYLKYYSSQNVVNGIILRLANVYGPGPKSSSSDRGILNLMIQKALNGETLTIFGEGNFLRDYIFIEDVAKAFLLAGVYSDNLGGRHFIIGSGHGTTIADTFNLVKERVFFKTGKTVTISHIPPPQNQSPIDLRNFIADSSNFKNITGWHPEYNLKEGIDCTIEYFIKK